MQEGHRDHFKDDQKIDPAKTDVKHWDSSCKQLDEKCPRNDIMKANMDKAMKRK